MQSRRRAVTTIFMCAAVMGCESKTHGFAYDEVAGLSARDAAERITYGNDPLQYALLWPAIEARGTVIFVHGGCWLSAYDLSHSRPFSAALADAGYDSWSLEYRRTGNPGGGWPGSAEDVHRAIAAVLKNAPTPPVFLLGHSAGGHLALLSARDFDAVTGTIGLAAITDLVTYAQGTNSCEQATSAFMGGAPEALPDAYAEATLVNKPVHGNTILLHGGRDAIVAPAHAALAGAETLLLPEAGHFDWIHPHSEAFHAVLRTLAETTP